MNRLIDLTNKKFGKLTVIKRAENGVRKSGQKYTRWLCLCDCGKEVIVDGFELRRNKCTNCGCESTNNRSISQRKNNTYVFFDNYISVFDSKNNNFIIDTDDYDLIKNDYFRVMSNGYVYSTTRGLLHRLIMRCPEDKVVDHQDGVCTNNRKSNLKICTQTENVRKSNNRKSKSGVTGVTWDKRSGKWLVRIAIKKGKTLNLGLYKNLDDAIRIRLKAEKEYFKEFAPQKHLYLKYKII